MTAEQNRELVRRFIDEVLVDGNEDAADRLLTDDFAAHTWGPMEPGPAGMKAAMRRVAGGLSNVSMEVHEMVAERDLVAVWLTSRATQSGQFMGLPPTGRSYQIDEMHLFRARDGRIAEHWHQADFLGLFRQLGVAPPGIG